MRLFLNAISAASFSGIFAWLIVLPASAQTVEARRENNETPLRRTYTKNTAFNLPIQMTDDVRDNLAEVQLFVKVDGKPWTQQQVVSPETPHFTFQSPHDGTYLFAVVTVDKAGKPNHDVTKAPPTAVLRVVVDTKPPEIEAEIVKVGDDNELRVKVTDVNLDRGSIRVAVKFEEGERVLTPIDDSRNEYRVSARDLELAISVTASDLSGNTTTKNVAPKRTP